MTPLLSVVVANYNYGRFIETAIQSVLDQNNHDVELIVVDGGSTDDSVSIIRQYASRIAWWCSEKDGGQSNAFNKGFSHAKGKYLTWLNADDVFFPGAIKRICTACKNNPQCEWFAGGCCWLDPDLRIIRCSRGRPFSLMRAAAGDIQVYAPSSVFARSLFQRFGGYVDEQCNYVMDIELWNRFYYKGGVKYVPLQGYNWGLRLHPEAKMSGHNFKESPLSDLSHPVRRIREEEYLRVMSQYAMCEMNRMKYALSISPLMSIVSRLDTLRFRGKFYKEVFK